MQFMNTLRQEWPFLFFWLFLPGRLIGTSSSLTHPALGGTGLLPPSGKQATGNGEAWLGVSTSYNPVLFYVHSSVFTHGELFPY